MNYKKRIEKEMTHLTKDQIIDILKECYSDDIKFDIWGMEYPHFVYFHDDEHMLFGMFLQRSLTYAEIDDLANTFYFVKERFSHTHKRSGIFFPKPEESLDEKMVSVAKKNNIDLFPVRMNTIDTFLMDVQQAFIQMNWESPYGLFVTTQ